MTTISADPDRLFWPTLVAKGIAARQSRDDAQWELGDLAAEVETTYAGGELEQYAEEIGVEYSTLRVYKAVAEAYEFAVRTAHVSWSHYERIASRPDRLEWLALAAAAHKPWSVRQMLAEIEKADAAAKAKEEEDRQLAKLRAMSEDLIDQVIAGTLSIEDAIGQALTRQQEQEKAEREESDRKRRFTRAIGGAFVDLWAYLDPDPSAAIQRSWEHALSPHITLPDQARHFTPVGLRHLASLLTALADYLEETGQSL